MRDTGYKILGFAVWQSGKWYVRRKYPDAGRKLAIAGGGAGLLVIGGAVALATLRRANNDN